MQTLNLNRNLLAGDQIGVVFGEFAPFHKGHLSIVQRALMENDAVVLIVSGSHRENDRGESIRLPLERRFRYLREVFNDEPTLRVQMLNEDEMPSYPNGWQVWTEEFRRTVLAALKPIESQQTFHIYTAETEYIHELTTRLSKHWQVELLSREEIPISATMIRENPHQYWNYIVPEFRRHFVKKVLVAGSASTGKSTLVRRLAKQFEAPFSEEHARLYEEQFNVDDDELTASDYSRFINGQFDLNQKAIDDKDSKGLALLDTDAIVTKVYARLYLPEAAYQEILPQLETTIAHEKIDKILVIPPVTKYVDDGFRAMGWADSRWAFHNELMDEFHHYGLDDKIVLLDQDDENGGFYARYRAAKAVIEELLQQKY